MLHDEPDKLRSYVLDLVRAHKLTRRLPATEREDVAQSLLAKYLVAFPGATGPENVEAYFETLVRNAGIDRIRGEERREVLDDPVGKARLADGELDGFFGAPKDEQFVSLQPVRQALLDQVLDLIPSDAAEILRARFLDGDSAREVAASLGITPAAVDQRTRRAKTHLRDALSARPDLVAELRRPHPHVYGKDPQVGE